MRTCWRALALLTALTACHKGEQPDTDGPQAMSFAILADLHVGEGHDDFGSEDWDDKGGEEDELTERLRVAIDKVNAQRQAYDLQLVMVLGDLTDSAERSELQLAAELLDELELPWVPLLGNHDAWPYTRDGESFSEAPYAQGDQLFAEVFGDQLSALQQQLEDWRWDPQLVTHPELDSQALFVNHSFRCRGWQFLSLDLNPRCNVGKAYPGVDGSAQLHDFEGGSWPWLEQRLDALQDDQGGILLFAHHPFIPTSLLALDDQELEQVRSTLSQGAGQRVLAQLAGHLHVDMRYDEELPFPVLVTPAAKDDSLIRIVSLGEDGSLSEFLL